MKTKLIFSGFFILAILLIVQCTKKSDIEQYGQISGVVKNFSNGEPLAGASVTLSPSSSTRSTGTDGTFAFAELSPGQYTVQVAKDGFQTNSVTVTVVAGESRQADILLKPAQPIIKVSNQILDFGTDKSLLPLEISNDGAGQLTWSLAVDKPWLSSNPVSGNVAAGSLNTVNISIDRSQLSKSTFIGTIVISSNGGSATIKVTVNVSGPILNVTPTSLDFGSYENEKSLSIQNIGINSLSYEAQTSQSWITLTNPSGVTTNAIKIIPVTVNRAGLSAGNYTGEIIVNSNTNSVTIPISMQILAPSAPIVINGTVNSLTYNSAQVSGNMTSLGSGIVTQHGHCWATSPSPTTANNKTSLGSKNTIGEFTSNISGLSPSTTYYVRAYATNAVGTTYSDDVIFTTNKLPTLAAVTTLPNPTINGVDASVSGEVTDLGDGLVTQHGHCISISQNPTIAGTKSELGAINNTATFSSQFSNLSPLTTYYVRSYATNSVGTSYGNQISFTTGNAPPVVTNGLIAYYTFDGQDAKDFTGNYNGINQGAQFVSDIPNNIGYSASFNGSSFISIPQDFVKDQLKISFSFWVKTNVNGGIFCNTNVSGSGSYPFYIRIINNSLGFSPGNYGWFWEAGIDVSSLIFNNSWHLITITAESKSQLFYIDGILIGSMNNNNNPVLISGSGCNIGRSTSNNPSSLSYFNGKIDNFRFYNRILSSQEISEIFNAKQ